MYLDIYVCVYVQYVQYVLDNMYSMYSMYNIYCTARTICTLCTICAEYLLPNIPNIINVLTSIAHRFGHQSGPYKSSGHKSTILQNSFTSSVDSVFSNICTNYRSYLIYTFVVKQHMFRKRHVLSQTQNACDKPVQPCTVLGGTNT